ncbi:hypothetical protein [Azospirillum cavernae]|uniref:hypothetical protein n=1 Tax=Azospirillum cavernae TaxID=2320860 RepID=UPI0011C3A955|nr:hypothetical protein [Azospirillum cavernae]
MRRARGGDECSAGSVWRLAAPAVPDALASVEDRRAISRAADPLPAGSAMILERPLGGGAPRVDFSLCLTRGDGGGEILAGRHPTRDVPPAWLEQPEWRSVRAHCRDWTEPGSLLSERSRSAWLEFDGDQMARRRVLPSLFVDFRDVSPTDRRPLRALTVATLIAPDARAGVESTLERVAAALPAHAAWQFLGVMLPRDRTQARLCVALPVGEVKAFVAGVGLSIDDQTTRLIAVSARHAASVVLHLDVGERLGATLGAELKPAGEDGWAALLTDLEREGLCVAAEREALLAFPGQSGMVRDGGGADGFADAVIGAPDMWRQVAGCLVVRSLNHVKLVSRPGQALAAKAYLHLGCLWRWRGDG